MIIFYNQFRATQSILENERDEKIPEKSPLPSQLGNRVEKSNCSAAAVRQNHGVGAMLEIQNGAGSGGGRD